MIIQNLKDIQHRHGYIPERELRRLSARINVPLYQLYGVATFYPHFRLTPPADIEIRVCRDMSCHMRGQRTQRARIEQILREVSVLHDGSKKVQIDEVSCLGRCDGAPAFAINDTIYSGCTDDELWQLVSQARAGQALPPQPIARRAQRLRLDPYDAMPFYRQVKSLAESQNFEKVIAELKASGMRGMGGAGFPTGMKWELVRKFGEGSGIQKYVVCNADESEPGTFKDREIIRNAPHCLIEGIILGGLTIGATQGYLFIRHEYDQEARLLQETIDAARQAGAVGKNIFGSGLDFELEVFVSPGGYICGEETALLEAIEGKRAEPRNKPPFPGTHGLWQKPTLLNNVESFAWVPLILTRGGEWYKSQGVNGAAGLKFIGVSGHVNRPGVYEIPLGTTARDLIDTYAGGVLDRKALKAFAPSGASSGFLPAAQVDIPMDWKPLQDAGTMLGSGAMVVFAEGTCMVDAALCVARFFRNESCGKCVPCRLGTQKIVDLLTEATTGSRKERTFTMGQSEFHALIDELALAMGLTSICGLGQIAPAPIKSVMKYWPDEINDHVLKKRCPAGTCFV
ncbi:MAG TPA: NAD(P)H-dependent oxidoreductase subunit E [Phycisphaerae bacterium]